MTRSEVQSLTQLLHGRSAQVYYEIPPITNEDENGADV